MTHELESPLPGNIGDPVISAEKGSFLGRKDCRNRNGCFPFLVGKEEEYPTIVVGWNPLIGCKEALGLLVY